MLKCLVLASLVAACSSKNPPEPSQPPQAAKPTPPSAPPEPEPEITRFFTAEVSGVMRADAAANTVAIDFDYDMFDGLDLVQLQGWVARHAGRGP